jgi:sedoheptulokinase
MLLGIDIGTSKVAAVIADRDGAVAAWASRPHGADLPAPAGRAEQDPERLLELALGVAAELPDNLRRQCRAVGVTGQMHGVVALDAAGRALTPLVTWQDRRCLEDPEFLPALLARTHRPLHAGYGGATLAWLQRHGQLPRPIALAATIQDLLVARLCGLPRPVTDPTSAAGWGLLDLASMRWDLGTVEAIGLPASLLPELLPCAAHAGAVTAAMAQSVGIPAGVPVAVAIGDNQASLLATVGASEEDLALTLGTGAQLSCVVGPSRRPADAALVGTPEQALEYRPFPGGRLAAVAASLAGGAAWEWLAGIVEGVLRDLRMPAPPRAQLYERLNALGLAAPSGLVVDPSLVGERHDPTRRGSIRGIGPDNFTLATLARGLAEGICRNLRDMLPPALLAGRKRLVGSGNALRRNPLLQHAAEEVFQLPLTIYPGKEEAATGAAINARGLWV